MAACFRSKSYWCSEDDCVITMLMVVLKLTVYPHNIQDEEEITIHHDVVDVDVEVDVVEYCCLLLVAQGEEEITVMLSTEKLRHWVTRRRWQRCSKVRIENEKTIAMG